MAADPTRAAYPAEPGAASSGAPTTANSVGELLATLSADFSTLVRQEVELAKAEAIDEARRAGKAAAFLGGAGMAGWMVELFASVAVMAGLANVMDWGWAALIVTALWAVAGGFLFATGRGELRRMRGMPRTQQTLKEDAQWVRHPTS